MIFFTEKHLNWLCHPHLSLIAQFNMTCQACPDPLAMSWLMTFIPFLSEIKVIVELCILSNLDFDVDWDLQSTLNISKYWVSTSKILVSQIVPGKLLQVDSKGLFNISYGFTNPNNVQIAAEPPIVPKSEYCNNMIFWDVQIFHSP